MSTDRREPMEHGAERFLLRCGECGIWRGCILGPRAARALARRLRRDRKRTARILEQTGRRRTAEHPAPTPE